MAWDDAPPTADELTPSAPTSGWDATPPTPEELKGPQWSDLKGNIAPDAENIASGAISAIGRGLEGVYDLPSDAVQSGQDMLSGKSPMDTPLGQDAKTVGGGVVDAVAGIPKSLADLGSKSAWVNHPVGNALTGVGLLEGDAEGLLKAKPGTGLTGKFGRAIEDNGAREATSVAGISPATVTKLTPRGGNEATVRANLGKKLIDDKVVGGLGNTAEEIRTSQNEKRNQYGDQVKDILNQIKNSGVDPSTDADKALSPILEQYVKLSDGALPQSQNMAKTFASVHSKLENIANKNGGKLGIDDLHDVMDEVGQRLSKAPKESPERGELDHLYGTLARSKDSIVDDVSQRSGNPQLAAQLKDANKNFHTYNMIGKDVGKTAAKEGVEKESKLGMFGAMWALVNGEPGKAAEYFLGSRLLGPSLKEIAPSMSQHSVQIGRMMQKYGPMLTQAAKKGGRNLAMTNYVLSQTDPEYKSTLSSIRSSSVGNGEN